MPAQDMLDVVHYFFESDNLAEKEVQDAKVKMRQVLYGQLYKRTYTWGSDTGTSTADGWGGQEVGASPMHAANPVMTHKPYIPPTPVNAASGKPFGTALDAPLG